jgi:surface protein
MFRNCSSFDSDVSRWNVSSATDLSGIFRNCSSFDSDAIVNGWDISDNADSYTMVRGCRSLEAEAWAAGIARDMFPRKFANDDDHGA